MSQTSPTSRASLQIEGMSCGHCVAAVHRALESVPGVEVLDVQIGRAEVAFNSAEPPREAIKDAIEDAGYFAEVVSQ